MYSPSFVHEHGACGDEPTQLRIRERTSRAVSSASEIEQRAEIQGQLRLASDTEKRRARHAGGCTCMHADEGCEGRRDEL
eukprot:6201590-Pleurochrysis_carterae.AAC.1